MNDIEKIKQIKNNSVCKTIDDEMVIVPLVNDVIDMKDIYALNDVGAFIWEHIEYCHNIEDIVDRVINHFEIEKPVARKDVADFIKDILKTFDFLI